MAAVDNLTSSSAEPVVNSWNIGWTLAYSFVVLLVCVSNLLIMVAFTTKALRKRSYYQVINLSAADLAVGIIVMPLYIRIQMMAHSTKQGVQYALYFIDPFFGLASFLILATISCERLHAVVWPYKHRLLRKWYYAISLALPWLIAAANAATDGWPRVSWLPFPVFLIVISLGLIVICSSYVVVWIKKTSSTRSQSRLHRMPLKHKRLAKTLFITTIASLITWLPFYLYVVYHLVCIECPKAFHHLAFALKLLQFSNSFINGMIYSLRISELRGTIRRVFRKELSGTIPRMNSTSRMDPPVDSADKKNVAEDIL